MFIFSHQEHEKFGKTINKVISQHIYVFSLALKFPFWVLPGTETTNCNEDYIYAQD